MKREQLVPTRYLYRVFTHTQAYNKSFSIDPITIIALINCIISIIRLLYLCYGRDSINKYYKVFHKPGIISEMMVTKKVNKFFAHKTKSEREDLKKALLYCASQMSESEIKELIQNIQ